MRKVAEIHELKVDARVLMRELIEDKESCDIKIN